MLLSYIRLLRPSDWLKNLLVYAALIFGRKLSLHNPAPLLAATGAFVTFCLLASGFYAINDALDVDVDRLHPVKRNRPVAAGSITPRQAVVFGVILILAGLALGFYIHLDLGRICCAYVVLQILYNIRLKRVLMVDVVTLSLGFVLRAAAGGAAIGVPISVWLVLCVFFLCLYLGFIKRLSDVTSAGDNPEGKWHSPAGYDNRQELNWLLALSAALAIVTYLMYSLSDHTANLFGTRAIGFALLSPLVIIAVYRMYRRAVLGRSDRPLDAFIEDRGIQASTLLFAAGVVVTVYAPHVDQFLGRLFLLK